MPSSAAFLSKKSPLSNTKLPLASRIENERAPAANKLPVDESVLEIRKLLSGAVAPKVLAAERSPSS